MTLAALDWNGTRARMLLGPAGDYALPVPLEPPALDLPMALALDPKPRPGSAGRRLLRQAPHQVCHNFLPYLTTPGAHGPRWQSGRRPFDAAAAATAVWERMHDVCRGVTGIVLALPAYCKGPHAEVLRQLGEKQRLPAFGSLPTPLAAALAAHAEGFWSRSVIVVDVDDHALTLTAVRAAEGHAHVIETRIFPALGLRLWHDRFISALADLCVWQIRRDPRDTPAAEQALYEQLDGLMDACMHGRAIEVGVQAVAWYHHFVMQPERTLAVVAALVEQVLGELDRLVAGISADEPPTGIVFTQAAGMLPGLKEAARAQVRAWNRGADTLTMTAADATTDDFGEDLVFDVARDVGGVLVLPADAPARAAHGLAEALRTARLRRGHHDMLAPLPPPQALEAGPARLHFQGQDYFLREPSFTLGSQPDCQLRFENDQHPAVAARHCEIVFDHRTFILFNRSRDGTLVNDQPVAGSVVLQPGDWIRLGLSGPSVRFLGCWAHRHLPTPA